MKNLKYILLIVISFSLFVRPHANENTNYDIKLNNNEILISFIMDNYINALYIKEPNYKTLIVLNYNKDDKMLEEVLKKYEISNIDKLYNTAPVILKLFNINSEYLKTNNNIIDFKFYDKNFCIYIEEYQSDINFNKCNFLYLLKFNNDIFEKILSGPEIIFQNYNIPLSNSIQENIYDNWIELYTINKNEYTLLKISDDGYDTIVIPKNTD